MQQRTAGRQQSKPFKQTFKKALEPQYSESKSSGRRYSKEYLCMYPLPPIRKSRAYGIVCKNVQSTVNSARFYTFTIKHLICPFNSKDLL